MNIIHSYASVFLHLRHKKTLAFTQIFAKQVILNGFEVKNILVWKMVMKKKKK